MHLTCHTVQAALHLACHMLALEPTPSSTYTPLVYLQSYVQSAIINQSLYSAFKVCVSCAVQTVYPVPGEPCVQAQASDERRARSATLGKLDGVPTIIKEALDVVGFPSTLGWNYTYSGAGGVDLFPLQNAALVQRLLDGGAVIVGKGGIPPFSAANTRPITRGGFASWDGLVFNAVNAELVPGASSTGVATAVAAGMAVWGVAEEVRPTMCAATCCSLPCTRLVYLQRRKCAGSHELIGRGQS